jgi:hypothetical protein
MKVDVYIRVLREYTILRESKNTCGSDRVNVQRKVPCLHAIKSNDTLPHLNDFASLLYLLLFSLQDIST